MKNIAHGTAERNPSRRPKAAGDAVPSPTNAMHALMGLLRRGPVPLGELRPAAGAAGMDAREIDAALAVATRREAIALVLLGGVACIGRRRLEA